MMLLKNNVLLYYSNQDVFSALYPASFRVRNQTFHCQEQFLMYCKALFFKEWDLAKDIMTTTNAYDCKRFGTKVNQSENYTHQSWVSKRPQYALSGMKAKYRQNPNLCAVLLATGSAVLGEASPTDFDWGTGLSKNDDHAFEQDHWTGKNLHGHLTTMVRNLMLEETKEKPPVINNLSDFIKEI